MANKGISRRNFLRYTGSGLTAAALGVNLAPMIRARAQGSIEFWSQPYGDQLAWTNLLETLISEFRDESGIDVALNIVNWADGNANRTWLLAAQGGAHPDVGDMFWLYSHAGIGGGQHGPMPITQYKDALFPDLEERFFESALADVMWQGELYGIPWRGDIRPQIYRTDYLEEAGFDRPPDTWEEITEYAIALTRTEGGRKRWGFAFGFSTPIQQLIPYYWQAGGEFMTADGRTATIDNDAMRVTLQWMKDMVWTHEVVSPNFMEVGGGYNPLEDFVSGTLAMSNSVPDNNVRNIEVNFPEIEGRWALEIPAQGPDNRAAYSGAGYWGPLYGTQDIESSLQWIAFLSRDANMQRITEFTSGVSPNRQVMASDFWTDRDWKIKITETLPFGHTSQHPSPAWGPMVAASRGAVIYDLFYDAVVLQENMDEVIARTQARMQEEMDKVAF
jgi:multiple sugar transport system substrate-binding protein